MDDVPTQAPDLFDFPVQRFDSGITAKLSLALRAARVEIRCPSKTHVRAGKSVEGFRSTRNPSTSPHKAAGIRPTGGVGLRPAGLCDREHSPAVRHCGNASLAGRVAPSI